MPAKHPRSSAFTLIELLVVISVIAILIAIMLPALGKTRIRSRELAALNNIRTLNASFQLYHDTYKAYPYIISGVRPDDMEGPPPPPGIFFVKWYPDHTLIGTSSIWAFSQLWPGLLYKVSPWTESYPTWVSPGRSTQLPEVPHPGIGPGEISDVSYRYSNSFLAQGSLWKKGGPGGIVDDALLRATSTSDVTFPSSKVILWDADVAYYPKEPKRVNGFYDVPTPMAFVDGHVDLKNPKDAHPGVPNPLNANDAAVLHNTEDGVQGRDY